MDQLGWEYCISESEQLCSGIFWILSGNLDLSNYKFLSFDIPCNRIGEPNNTHSIELNSKKGNTYNHKKIWEDIVKKNSKYRPFNKKTMTIIQEAESKFPTIVPLSI